MATRIGTNWEGIPHTRATANMVELRKAEAVRVVRTDFMGQRNNLGNT